MTATLLTASLTTAPLAAPSKAVVTAVTTACTAIDTTSRARAGCAAQLQKALSADAASIKALQGAAAADSESAAKGVLKTLGLTDAALAGAVVVVHDQSGGAAKIKDVTIEISCCPLTITITIRL